MLISVNQLDMQKLQNYLVIDIGGTLCKLCFFSQKGNTTIPHIDSLTINLQNSSLYFNVFKTFQSCFQFLSFHFTHQNQYDTIALTGGGSYKYYEKFASLDKKIIQVKEFESLLQGLSFFRINKFDEFILTTFQKGQQKSKHYPLLVVNIGSGVSILKVSMKQNKIDCERVGGTSLGGGYFMGLSKLLLNESNFIVLQELAKKGTNQKIDVTPNDYKNIPNSIEEASVLISLGKLSQKSQREDIAKSLFNMVSFNIAQIALMYSDISNISDVIFTGYFCRDNTYVLECFAEAFTFFQSSNNTPFKRVYSLTHDGYLGTIGALQTLLCEK